MSRLFENIRTSGFARKIARWTDGDALYGLDNPDNFADIDPSTDPAALNASGARSGHQEYTLSQRIHYWILHGEEKAIGVFQGGATLLFSLLIIICLLITVAELPMFGDADNPTNNEVARRYIEDGPAETGAVNIVGGMILDYRAFDTLGESHVLFIGACAVMILLRNDRKRKKKTPDDIMFEPVRDPILQKVAKIQIPMILMFGIYIVMNGHISPGGGFSGGTVMGAALILYYNAFGSEKVSVFFTYRSFKRIMLCALGFYAISKGVLFYLGANSRPSFIGTGKFGAILSAGMILPLNIAVGLTVACTMFGFYSLFNREVI